MILALTTRAGAWLLQATATRVDTVVTRQMLERGWFDQTAHVASGLLVILLLVLAILVLPAAWYVRGWLREMTMALHGIRQDLRPILDRSSAVLDHVEQISGTVRQEVQRLGGTVREVDGKLREIVEVASDRVRSVDALVGAVQEEAEDLFLTTASAARGLRAGMRALRRHRTRRDERRAVEGDEAPEAGDADREPESPRPRAPRLRKRGHAS